MSEPLLRVDGLRVMLKSGDRSVPVVDGTSFHINPGEMLALVGESGCGKSMTALAILDLLPKPQLSIGGGDVRFAGRSIRGLPAQEIRKLRGADIAMIFQEPTTSLNPVLRIGDQLVEAVLAHQQMSVAAARERAIDLLTRVRITNPERRFNDYPHQMSGGMCQRVMIAMALVGNPRLLIADEPTTALDVTVQAQILELIADLQQETDMAVLLITHDLGVVAGFADRVAVMYAGRIVEQAPVDLLFAGPVHPYTDDLLQAAPHFSDSADRDKRFREIPGQVPPPGLLPAGCSFAPRCSRSIDACREQRPELRPTADRFVACHLSQKEAA